MRSITELEQGYTTRKQRALEESVTRIETVLMRDGYILLPRELYEIVVPHLTRGLVVKELPRGNSQYGGMGYQLALPSYIEGNEA